MELPVDRKLSSSISVNYFSGYSGDRLRSDLHHPTDRIFDKKTSFPAQDPQSHQQLFSWDLYVYSDDRAECGHHKTDPQIRFPCILDPFTCCVCDCRSDLHHAKHINVTPYEVTVDKSAGELDSLKIVLIADTHFGYNAGTIHAKEIVKKINKQNPDLVCIAGDIFDNEYEAIHEPKKVKKILRKINSRYGVYACWGNHDLNEPILAGFTFNPGKEGAESLKDPRMREFLKDSNIQLLEDEAVLIDNSFYVVGRKDASLIEKIEEKRKTPAQLTEKLDKDKPIIFIDHQPKELQEIADAGVDLDLCGHTHDGQTFPGNITIKFLWENPCGYLQKGSMHNIVTSGSGVWGPAMRVGTNSEICTINVTFQNS